MNQTKITLNLPDSLASEAEANGLLEPEIIEGLLREELRRRWVDQLFEASEQLSKLNVPALTEAEVEAEIRAASRNPAMNLCRDECESIDFRTDQPYIEPLIRFFSGSGRRGLGSIFVFGF